MSRPSVERHVRQQHIVDVARQVFITNGIDKSTMEGIAGAAGLTRRTLYAYFKSRDEISLMVLVDDNRNRWSIQREALAHGADGLRKIRIWGESLWKYSKSEPHSMRLQVWWDLHGIDRRLINDELFEQFEQLNDELAAGLRQVFHLGVSDGSLLQDLPVDITISHFLQTIRAVIHRALSPDYSFTSFDPDEYVEQFLDLFISGIENRGDIHD